jgi:hypothetical protein
MAKTNTNVIKTGEPIIISVLFFGGVMGGLAVVAAGSKLAVRDRNALRAGSSPLSKGSKIFATFS